MNRMRLPLLFLLVPLLPLFGQNGNNVNGVWTFTTTSPAGNACNQGQSWVLMPSGALYTCQNGTATEFSGAGGAPPASATVLGTNGGGAFIAAPLANGKIWAGSAGSLPVAVTPSGGVTMTNAGVFTLGLPAVATLGGVFSKAAVTHNFLTSISSADGSIGQAQPACADLSDSGTGCSATIGNYQLLSGKDVASGYAGLDVSVLLKTAEFPAFTGDCTTTSGTVALTCTKINGTTFPTSATVIGSNGSAQPIAATTTGSGTTVVLGTSPFIVTPSLRGVDGTTTYITATVNSLTSGYGAFLQYTDNTTYNFGAGTDPTTGDFAWYSGRFPGTAGTLRARLTQGGVWTIPGTTSSALYATATRCSNGASPAVCAAAAAGSVAVPTGVTTVSLVVNTTAVTANSQITLTPDDSVTIAATTCNNVLATLTGGLAITARTAGTSFTITYNGTIATNPLCLNYSIVN